MEKRRDINYGTGNSFTKVTIENLENGFSGFKEVTITKNADGSKTIKAIGFPASGNSAEDNASQMSSNTFSALYPTSDPTQSPSALAVKEAKRDAILKYVGNVLPLVMESWYDNYMPLWEDIVEIPEVAVMIYDKGRQQHTTFNRREVLHIICFLGKYAFGKYGIFEEDYNATQISLMLKDGCEKSTRPELGYNTTKPIQAAIMKLMNSKKYTKRKNGKKE